MPVSSSSLSYSDYLPIPSLEFEIHKGLLTDYVSQKWGGPDPPSPFVSHCQHFATQSPPLAAYIICEQPLNCLEVFHKYQNFICNIPETKSVYFLNIALHFASSCLTQGHIWILQ